MKKPSKFLGIFAFTVLIAFTMSACDDGKTPKIDPCINGHTPGAAATCETAQSCTVCSYVIKAAIGHNFGEWAQKTIATCVAPERVIRVCSYNTTHTEEENHGEVDPTAHAHTSSLICKNGTCGHQYEIGDPGPAGGIIFYVVANGFTVQGYSGALGSFDAYTAYYLEAAFTYYEVQWWGANGTLIDGVTTWADTAAKDAGLAASIGVGRKDTQIIVNHLATTEETGRAAQVCASKTETVGGTIFNDWFLPSLGELNEMYKAMSLLYGIKSGWSWSSSQVSNSNAWAQYLPGGSQYISKKNETLVYVRAIRAF